MLFGEGKIVVWEGLKEVQSPGARDDMLISFWDKGAFFRASRAMRRRVGVDEGILIFEEPSFVNEE